MVNLFWKTQIKNLKYFWAYIVYKIHQKGFVNNSDRFSLDFTIVSNLQLFFCLNLEKRKYSTLSETNTQSHPEDINYVFQ